MSWFLLKVQMYQALPCLADLETNCGDERCGNCGAGHSRCLHGRYLLNFEDLEVGACLKYVGQKEDLQGETGIVCDVKRGYFKMIWTNHDSKSSKPWRVTAPDGDGSFILQFKFHCQVPADAAEGLLHEIHSENIEPAAHEEGKTYAENNCFIS